MVARIVVGAVMLILAASCGDTTTETSPTTVTTAPAPTALPDATSTPPTSTPAPTTSAAPVTTLAPACPEGPRLPDDASDLTSESADFDADGLPDLLHTYLVLGEERWHVRIVFGAGGSADLVIEDSGTLAPARPIGGFDIESDGTLEAFVTVGSGASAALVGFYDVADCGLARITVNRSPALFAVGASVGNTSGIYCGVTGDINEQFASRVGEDEYEGGFVPYSLSGSVLTAGFGDGADFTSTEAAALAVLDCGGLVLP